ncbi:uncharacterized protein [Littorina saxatilis]|uniref:Phosphate ABC transporter substrate-binding protein n=1 Tax=Littorina saxatilis TaxID=31220 RepID=A0AAN9FVA1_9CAEN
MSADGVKSRRGRLRIMTYLSPGVQVGLFELIRDYLESVTGLDAYLIYESRWSGPPCGRVDPFTADDVDIAFMCSTAYSRLKQNKNAFMELCPAAALHSHPMATGRPVYFSDLMVHTDNKDRFKDFHALKGCRWAYNDDISLSGNLVMMAELKKHGYDANFFGSSTQSGSHLNSIQLILNGRADAAAIDSNTISGYKMEHPEKMERLHTIMSLGPMPIYPIVFNNRLSAELKSSITKALLGITQKPEWGQRLLQMGVVGYTEVDETFYGMENEIQDMVKNMSLAPAYY